MPLFENTITALNDVTKALIDSQKGYELACEMLDGAHGELREKLCRRADTRRQLVARFQNEARFLGGKPETEGAAFGPLQRGLSRLNALFASDVHAALSAVDEVEHALVSLIEEKLEDRELDYGARILLEEARIRGQRGEDFAEQWLEAA